MKGKLLWILSAGILAAGMPSAVYGAEENTEVKGEVYAFIAASLSNSMEEIQKDFNEIYPGVEIFYNADSSGTLQTQIQEGARCDIFFSAARQQMDTLLEEGLVKEDTVTDLLENKVVLIKPAGGETAVTGFENITAAEEYRSGRRERPGGAVCKRDLCQYGDTGRSRADGDQRGQKCDRGPGCRQRGQQRGGRSLCHRRRFGGRQRGDHRGSPG